MPALYTSIQAVLSLYASGRTTGIVLDSGDGVSHAVPVYEGFAMPSSIRRIDVAGRDITEYLQTLLRKSGYIFHTSAEKEVVRHIKEAACYITRDPKREEKEWASAKHDPNKQFEYTLPDGSKLKVGPALYCFRPARWGQADTGFTDRSGALQGPRDPLRPRDRRPRVPRRAPDRDRVDPADGHGPPEITVRQHSALGREHPDEGVRRPAAVRAAEARG